MVSGARSATHHPIMVAGPQIGYYYPGFTTEVVENAPGIHQRGVTSAPFPGYIFIGRSQDQSWSRSNRSSPAQIGQHSYGVRIGSTNEALVAVPLATVPRSCAFRGSRQSP